MNNRNEKVAKSTVNIIRFIVDTSIVILWRISNIVLGIFKGVYDVMNYYTKNIVNSLLYYLFGFLYWIAIIFFIPTIFIYLLSDTEQLSATELAVSILVGLVSITFKYLIYKYTDNYRRNKLGLGNSTVIKKSFYIFWIIFLITCIIAVGIFVYVLSIS